MNLFSKTTYCALISLTLTFFSFQGQTQTNMVFYPMEDQFNSSSFNPAFLTSESQFTFSVLPLAGFNMGYNNQRVITELASKLLKGINQDEDYLDIVRTMVDRHSFNQKLEIDLLSFIYRSPEGFFNFRIRDNVGFDASIQGPVANFMIKPEVKSLAIGKVQQVPVQIIHYREYSVAYSSPADHQTVSWGVRGKLYYGKGVFSSDISGSIENVADNYYFKTKGYGKMSMPEERVVQEDGTVVINPSFSANLLKDYLLNAGNSGLGIDFGMRVRVNSRLSISASVLDIGNIKWKNNLTSKDFNSQSLLEGDRFDSRFENGVEIITKNRDSISFENKFSNLFKVDQTQKAFATTLPVTFFTGVKYRINPRVSLSLTDRYIRRREFNHNTIALGAAFSLNQGVTLSTGYSMIGDAYNNLSAAILLKRNFGQIWLGTDNILSFANSSSSEYSGITFGACFYILRKRDLYRDPDENFPFYRPKKVRKVPNNGRIQKETTDFGFPEMY